MLCNVIEKKKKVIMRTTRNATVDNSQHTLRNKNGMAPNGTASQHRHIAHDSTTASQPTFTAANAACRPVPSLPFPFRPLSCRRSVPSLPVQCPSSYVRTVERLFAVVVARVLGDVARELRDLDLPAQAALETRKEDLATRVRAGGRTCACGSKRRYERACVRACVACAQKKRNGFHSQQCIDLLSERSVGARNE